MRVRAEPGTLNSLASPPIALHGRFHDITPAPTELALRNIPAAQPTRGIVPHQSARGGIVSVISS